MLLLTRRDVEALLDFEELYEAVRQGFSMAAQGRWELPLRTAVTMGTGGVMLTMPSSCEGIAAAGLKLATVVKENPSKGLPAVHSAYAYVSGITGEILSFMDAEYLTGMRTAATSVLATRLAGKEDAGVAAIFGTGVQAWFHAKAFAELMGTKEFLVLGRTTELGKEFAARIREELGVDGRPATLADLKAAQVICTCTPSDEPLFGMEHVAAAAHINAVGAFRPASREIGGELVARSTVIVDSREGASSEAGEIVLAIQEGLITSSHIYATLDELASGAKPKPLPRELTLFKSLGLALEDLVAAHLIYGKAVAARAGSEVTL